jgi:hypothetical protein
MFYCPCILQKFLVNNQLDASIPFNIFIYFQLARRDLEINKYIERNWCIKLVMYQEFYICEQATPYT